ncbi:MAG: Alcohol dehydrogenase 2 [Firmicutes bacterium ADurb.Bin080]|jgi:alcohol dehydrogenase|nr:MAG: Alcohol dehydrogenase 2 [Firmicutes bacterium ADurb.Bin080]
MNVIKKIASRVFQGAMYIVTPFLPWRKPELLVGENKILELPNLIKKQGLSKVLVVTSKDLIDLGLLNGLFTQMKNDSLEYVVYDGTIPNPTIDNIEEGLALYNENNCQGIIAFGGGSPMDCAKGIGARVARPDKKVSQMKGLLKILKKLPLVFAVPTTAGTGSEVTVAAVITDSSTHEKYPINDPMLIPRFAVLDPLLTLGLPKGITSTTGVDALTHAVEAYIGKGNTSETKDMAEKAVKLIHDNLYTAYSNGKDIEARMNMQLAAHYAGIAFTRAYVGYVHAIAHSLGGQYSIPHGLANAIILPHVLEYYGDTVYDKLSSLAKIVGIVGISSKEKAERFIQWIKDLNKSMGIPNKVPGIIEEDIPVLVKRALSEANPLYPVPKFMDEKDMNAMYHQIMA